MKFDQRGCVMPIIALLAVAQPVHAVDADAPARKNEHRDTVITVSPLFGWDRNKTTGPFPSGRKQAAQLLSTTTLFGVAVVL